MKPFLSAASLKLIVFFIGMLNVINGQPLVPAMFIFGDSVVDVGNNNHLLTVVKANFPPYGRDFITHSPTGRFCNGKLAADFTGKKTDINICQHTVCLYLIFDSNKCFLPTKNMHAHRKNSFCKPNFSRSELSNLSNGHFVAVAAENIGFTSYPPAYLSKKAKGNNLLIGANFASASSGYYDATAELYVSCTIYFIYSWSVQ